jgi:hypothetical protein
MILAEVRRFEELLNQDDVRALSSGRADQVLRGREVLIAVSGTGELCSSNSNFHDDVRVKLVDVKKERTN